MCPNAGNGGGGGGYGGRGGGAGGNGDDGGCGGELGEQRREVGGVPGLLIAPPPQVPVAPVGVLGAGQLPSPEMVPPSRDPKGWRSIRI